MTPVNSKDRGKKDVWFGRAKYIIMVTAFSNSSLRVREKIIKNTVSKTIFNKLKVVGVVRHKTRYGILTYRCPKNIHIIWLCTALDWY